MSTNSNGSFTIPVGQYGSTEDSESAKPAKVAVNKNYKGFVAGLFSGIAKLSG